MKKYIIICCSIIVIILLVFFTSKSNEDILEVHIGYQSVTSQTWGALIIKNKNIFLNKLKVEYPNKKIKIVWHDEISGAQINTSMISNKINIGFMGDMPLILNMYKSHTIKNYNSILIAIDGIGINGKNQSIVVSSKSNIKSIYDLSGKTISTPIGSSSHFMLMKVLKKYDMLDEVEIVHQDVSMASQLLINNSIDAFSIWEPYPTFFQQSNIANTIIDGTESNIDYVAGVIANKDWCDNNKKICTLFYESLNEAHNYILSNQEESIKIFEKESGFNKKVISSVIGNIKWNNKVDDTIVENLNEKKKFLIELGQVEEFDLKDNISEAKYVGL